MWGERISPAQWHGSQLVPKALSKNLHGHAHFVRSAVDALGSVIERGDRDNTAIDSGQEIDQLRICEFRKI
jgi:hypothetical protein